MPVRIQRKRTRGWRMPPGAVYVGRGTRWGNPYAVTHCDAVHMSDRHWHIYLHAGGPRWLGTFPTKRAAIDGAVQRYRAAMAQYGDTVVADDLRAELAGKDLVCWCPLDQACHADFLLEVANEEAP